jgi:hypothetical protein
MMRRLWILFKSEFIVWRHDPITAVGGILPPALILIAFALLFGGRLSFKVAVVNLDQGSMGQVLRNSFDEVISPLGNVPYYLALDMNLEDAMEAYKKFQVEGVWVIPEDFSSSIESGKNPNLEMHFFNYNDDRAKNHRIYSAEIIWYFYKQIGYPRPPIEIAEQYPMPVMVDWVPVIAVGVALLSVCLGSIFNIYALTHKEQITNMTLEFGLAPRSLAWLLIPKVILALIFGLVSGTLFLIVIYTWLGFWPGNYIWAFWLLSGLTALFWIGLAIVVGLRSRNYMAGAIAIVLMAIIVFFIGGGLGLIRYHAEDVQRYSWLFPNTHAIDPIRDLVLFNAWPVDWNITLVKLAGFAILSLLFGMTFTARKLRRLG